MLSAGTIDSILARRMRQYDDAPMPATPAPAGLQMRIARRPMDERLPDGTPAQDVGLSRLMRERLARPPEELPTMRSEPLTRDAGERLPVMRSDAASGESFADLFTRRLSQSQSEASDRQGAGVPVGETDAERRRRRALVPEGAAAPPPPAPVFTSPAPGVAPIDVQKYRSELEALRPGNLPTMRRQPDFAPRHDAGARATDGIPLSVLDALRPSAPGTAAPLRPEEAAAVDAVLFEPSRVPLTRNVRREPAPGEEEANDARVMGRIEEAGGFVEGGGVHTRARIARPREFLEQRINDIARDPTRENTNGRWGGALRAGGRAARRILASGGSPAQAAGAFAAAFGLGAADTSLDERLGEMDAADRMRGALAGMNQREAERLKLEGGRADVDWKRQRPDLERDKLSARALERRQRSIQREIAQRAKDPRPFDETDAYDADLLERAAEEGISVNVAGFGDTQQPLTLEVLDPNDPQHIRKIRLQFDRATRQWSPVQAGGETVVTNRGQPVDDTGRTPAQRDANEDRDRAFDANQEYRAQQLALSTERLREQMLNGLSGRASREFTTATRGLFERRRQIESQVADFQRRAGAYTIDPADARRRIEELKAERDGITSQIDAERRRALGSMSAAPASGGARPGRFAGRRMPQKNLAAAARELGFGEGPEAERKARELIEREGGTVY